MKQFLRDYGFGFILFFLLLVTTSAYWHQTYAYTRQEAEALGQEWKPEDQRTEFWTGVWENDRSEYEQLFFQFLGMVALAAYITHKAEAKQDEILEELQLLKERLNDAQLPD